MMRGMIAVIIPIMMMGAGVRRMTIGLKLTTVVIKCILFCLLWNFVNFVNFEQVTMELTQKMQENNLFKSKLTNLNFMLGQFMN